MNKTLLKYRILLPPRIEVQIHLAEEGGFWAKVKTFPGCTAQGEDIYDLIEMVNVAIHDYLEVPEKLRKYLGHYEPEPSSNEIRKAFEDSRHKQIEEKISQLIRSTTTMQFSRVPA